MSQQPLVVILIDHKDRDLMGAALIAYHLENSGIQCKLEPLQSWRSCLSAWKPAMIVFNHLSSKILANYSAELSERGVLVTILLNEGLCLTDSQRRYLSEPQHENIHCDLFLTWNDLHKNELKKYHFVTPSENTITSGVPRFDFYRQPWLSTYQTEKTDSKTRVLVNTTFALAHFHGRSEEEQAILFSALGDGKIPENEDYKGMIQAHYNGMRKLPAFLKKLLKNNKYNVTLRPHPREELTFYNKFILSLCEEDRQRIEINSKESIQAAIINADVILNCENCTTSVESWIAQKPTITLEFDQHPVFYTDTYASRSPSVSNPDELIPAVEHALLHPGQETYQETRDQYLQQWIYKADGNSAKRAANAMIKTIRNRKVKSPDYPKGHASLRRELKTKLAHIFDEPSHTQFKHWFTWKVYGENCKHSMKYRNYLKAVRPSEARAAVDLIRHSLESK